MLKAEGHNWEEWKEAFLKTFNDKGWSAIRYAYNFKYLSGSIIEYALEKERLISEVKRKKAEDVRIHLIVIGLPIEVQDEIERERVQSTNDLMGILGQYEDQRKRKETQERKINLDKKVNPPFKKQPCTICETLNFPGRFHPVELCRKRNRNAQKKPKQINTLQIFASENEKVGTSNENEKN